MADGYQKDLAYTHDVGFGGFATAAAPGLLALLRRHGVSGGLVVDLGCGSGIWAGLLTDAGYDVLGVDYSVAMIALARKRAPGATFRVGSYLKAELPPCDAVTSIGECFNYLFDRDARVELTGLFGRVHNALRPGGVFVFDVLEPGQLRRGVPTRRHRVGGDWAVMVEVEEDAVQQVLTRSITSFRQVGKLYRRAEEVHRLRLYEGRELAAELERVGFRVRSLRHYGDFPLGKAHVALLARKE
ncbi:MAG TPA: class I SAM-dependent methyltransferase [Gemmataceae bacterium]|nr:class I SAM-dependent methyltransferase [Gemmataceae bacterium]